jgi:hypothetical protein
MPDQQRPLISARAAKRIGYEECAHLSGLSKAGVPSIFWLYSYVETLPNSPLLFPELASKEILEQHRWSPVNTQGIGFGFLPDALVSGKSLVGDEKSLFELGPLVPTYVDNYLRRGEPDVGDTSLANKSKRFLPGESILLTHWNCDVYGHWLLEGLPKLLLLRRLRHLFPRLRIIVPLAPVPLASRLLSHILRRGRPPSNATSYVQRWADIVLPGAVVETYDPSSEYLHCEALLSPTTLFSSPTFHFHPELAALLDELPGRPARKQLRLYITRKRASHYREMANAAEIEAIAAGHGLTVIAPETLPLIEQIRLFASAKLIVGEFGSAMHNALFSAPGTTVFCLNWINALQSRIAQLREQRIGYLLPDNGEAVKHVLGAGKTSYHIDPIVFRRCLAQLESC